MINADDKAQQELTAMAACVATVGQLEPGRERGRFLLQEFRAKPYLIKYWRAAYSTVPFTPQMLKRLGGRTGPAATMAHGLLNHDPGLRSAAGVTLSLLDAVLGKLGLPAVAAPITDEPAAGLSMRITSAGNIPTGHATFVLEVDGMRFGNGHILLDENGIRGLALLRQAVAVAVPPYVMPWVDKP